MKVRVDMLHFSLCLHYFYWNHCYSKNVLCLVNSIFIFMRFQIVLIIMTDLTCTKSRSHFILTPLHHIAEITRSMGFALHISNMANVNMGRYVSTMKRAWVVHYTHHVTWVDHRIITAEVFVKSEWSVWCITDQCWCTDRNMNCLHKCLALIEVATRCFLASFIFLLFSHFCDACCLFLFCLCFVPYYP